MTKTLLKYALRTLPLAAILALATVASPVYSQSNSQIEANKKQKSKYEAKIRELRSEKTSISEVIGQLDDQIDEYDIQLSTVKAQLGEANKKYEEHAALSEQLHSELAEHKVDLGQRAAAIYMQGDLTFLDLLFQATDMTDLVDRVFFVQAIVENDQKLVNDTQSSRERLLAEMQTLNEQREEIKLIESSLREVLDKYERQRGEKESTLRAVESEEALAVKRIREIEEENKRIYAELKSRKTVYTKAKWNSTFKRPCDGSITSGFGYRKHPIYKVGRMHTGVDIGAPKGTAVGAAAAGVVISTRTRGGYGKCVMIDHGNDGKGRNVVTLYAHLSKVTCNDGDEVTPGTKIGEVGSTGTSTGNHLHFEVRIDGDPVDPLKY